MSNIVEGNFKEDNEAEFDTILRCRRGIIGQGIRVPFENLTSRQ